MSQLKSGMVVRKTPVQGFAGVGAFYEENGVSVIIVCANAEELASELARLAPDFKYDPALFQPMTIIRTTSVTLDPKIPSPIQTDTTH
ncbi:MAG: hypothetical protein P4N60_19280 [Verrucomicrobiae bacterium]|nr:hypothetical protein [Verrucomicrobiae bacterium]